MDLSQFQKQINYHFKNTDLLSKALTHPSYAKEHNLKNQHNQRLEFLGDSVLSLVLADQLIKLFPNQREGTLAKYRSILAQGSTLSQIAQSINLHLLIKLSTAETENQGHLKPSILEDSLEALIAAIYLDGGFHAAQASILHIYKDIKQRLKDQSHSFNPKGQLQELIQQTQPNSQILYSLINEEGPPHNKTFTVNLSINDQAISTGSGSSKKAAEEQAATNALKSM